VQKVAEDSGSPSTYKDIDYRTSCSLLSWESPAPKSSARTLTFCHPLQSACWQSSPGSHSSSTQSQQVSSSPLHRRHLSLRPRRYQPQPLRKRSRKRRCRGSLLGDEWVIRDCLLAWISDINWALQGRSLFFSST